MIFPQLKDKKFGYINLNLEAEEWAQEKNLEPRTNPFIDPVICQEFIEATHKKYNLDFSYGGWMEDRSYIWRGGYLEESRMFTHLGVDINVPVGAEVAADFDAEVVVIMDDYPLDAGWGPHVILRNEEKDIYVLYAHLDREIFYKIGDNIKKGTIFAKVGKAPENGNWFPHVHVQVIRSEYFKELVQTKAWDAFDGYGFAQDTEINSQRHPDPLQYIAFF